VISVLGLMYVQKPSTEKEGGESDANSCFKSRNKT
jgi:hypothetical protein